MRECFVALGLAATAPPLALHRIWRRGIGLHVLGGRRRGLLILSGGVVSILIAVRPRAAA